MSFFFFAKLTRIYCENKGTLRWNFGNPISSGYFNPLSTPLFHKHLHSVFCILPQSAEIASDSARNFCQLFGTKCQQLNQSQSNIRRHHKTVCQSGRSFDLRKRNWVILKIGANTAAPSITSSWMRKMGFWFFFNI